METDVPSRVARLLDSHELAGLIVEAHVHPAKGARTNQLPLDPVHRLAAGRALPVNAQLTWPQHDGALPVWLLCEGQGLVESPQISCPDWSCQSLRRVLSISACAVQEDSVDA